LAEQPNNHAVWQQYDEKHSLHRASKRVRETEKPMTPQYECLKKLGGTWTSVQYKIGDEEKTFQFENIHQVLIRQMTAVPQDPAV
jgi:hypothetical protein